MCLLIDLFYWQGYNKESGELDFEKQSDYYKDLIQLLREKSPRFNELIDKKVTKL